MRPCVLLLAVVGLCYPVWAEEGVIWKTDPSADVTAGLVHPGVVKIVHVKDGQPVKKGDLLITLDDSVERARMEQAKLQAEDTVQIDAAKAQQEQKEVDLKHTQEAYDRQAATDMELDHAKLDVIIGQLSTKLAVFKQDLARLALKESQADLDRMEIRSPIDGIVEQVAVEVGEPAEALKPVIRIVCIDPLWIDAPVLLEQAASLKLDQHARVRNMHGDDLGVGTIVDISSVADSGSDTLRVRVSLPNPKSLPAGQKVQVFFGDKDTVAGPAAPAAGASTQPSTPDATTQTSSKE